VVLLQHSGQRVGLLTFLASVVARLGRLSAATVTRCGAPLDALVDGLLADLVDVGAADDNAIVAVWRSSRG
jgi:hypothetical protein